MALPHRIRRLRWNVTSAARDEGFAARAHLRQMHETGLLDEIERAFDAASSGDEVVHIPRLEIAVRVSAIERVGVEVANGIRRELTGHTAAPAAATLSPAAREASRERAAKLDAADRLIAYLESGLLPWPLANVERQSTFSHLQQAAALHFDRILARAPRSISTAAPFVFRWLQLLARDEWLSIARRLELSDSAAVAGLADAIAALIGADAPSLSDYRRTQLAAALIAFALCDLPDSSSGSPGNDDRQSIVGAFAAIASAPPQLSTSPSPSDVSPAQADAMLARLPAAAAKWVRARLTSSSAARSRSIARQGNQNGDGSGAMNARREGIAEPGAVVKVRVPIGDAGDERDERPSTDAFGLAVEHAGLILLHPFLPQLFERTGIIRAGEPTLGDEVLPRAAALLSFAARGDDEPIEFDLAFIKVLLGRRPETPLPLAAGLIDNADRQEVDELLASVVEHWKALKRTSIDGLRASFLQRRGLLAAADDGWQLRVEAKPFDLLVDHLPWGISTVKLRWMTAPIFTEWTTS